MCNTCRDKNDSMRHLHPVIQANRHQMCVMKSQNAKLSQDSNDPDLQAIDGEEPTDNALLQASSQHDRIVFFIHMGFEDPSVFLPQAKMSCNQWPPYTGLYLQVFLQAICLRCKFLRL